MRGSRPGIVTSVLEASPSLKTLPFLFGVINTLSLEAKACMNRRQHVLFEFVALGIHTCVLARPAGHWIPPFARHRLSDEGQHTFCGLPSSVSAVFLPSCKQFEQINPSLHRRPGWLAAI